MLFRKIFYTALITIFSARAVLATDIGEGESKNTSSDILDNNAVIFTGATSGTLDVNHTNIRTLESITSNNPNNTADGIGVIQFSDINTLRITGNLGSSADKIKSVNFNNFNGNLIVRGDIYTTEGITANDGNGVLILESDTVNFYDINIHSTIGSSSNKLSYVEVGNINASATFYDNVFTNIFKINNNSNAIISNSTTSNNLGATIIGTNASLTLNQNADLTTLTTTSSSIINIAAGKKAAIANAASLNGTLNVAIDSTASSNPAISSATDSSTINNSLIVNLDYSSASHLKLSDQYNLITTSSLNAVDTDTLNSKSHLSDNSILLKSSFTQNGNNLVLNNIIDPATKAKLNGRDLATVNFIADNSNTLQNIDTVRTELFKISTQKNLENALDSLQIEQNNMVQLTSFSVADAVKNTVDKRVQALNYQQVNNAPRVRGDVRGHLKNTQNIIKPGNIWGEFFGNRTSQDTREGEEGYNANFEGLTFGVDNIEKGTITGGAFSYTRANMNSNSPASQKTTMNSFQLALYNHNISSTGLGLFNENSANIGYNQYDSSRTIQVGSYIAQAQSKFYGTQYGAKTGLGYNVKVGQAILAPVASLKYSGLSLDNYQETGAGDFGLKVHNSYFDLITSDIGFRLMGQMTPRIYPQLNGSWSRNLSSGGAKSTTSFVGDNAGDNTVKNAGVSLLQNTFNVGLQFNIKSTADRSAVFKYEMQKSTGFTSQLIAFKYNVAF